LDNFPDRAQFGAEIQNSASYKRCVPRPVEYTCQRSSTSAQRSELGALKMLTPHGRTDGRKDGHLTGFTSHQSINQSVNLFESGENPWNNKNSQKNTNIKTHKNRQTDRQRKCNWQSTTITT